MRKLIALKAHWCNARCLLVIKKKFEKIVARIKTTCDKTTRYKYDDTPKRQNNRETGIQYIITLSSRQH